MVVSKKFVFSLVACLLAVLTVMVAAPEDSSFAVKTGEIEWQPVVVEGMPAGLKTRPLHENPRTKMSSSIVQYPQGFHEPRHHHVSCGHYIYILKGRLQSPDGDLLPGMFTYAAPKESHGPYTAVEATEILFYTDGPFDFIVDK
jgi:hypothetical protein